MSDLRTAKNRIETLEDMAREDKWVNRLHPLIKLLITIYFIVLTVSFSKYDLNGLLGMILYPIGLFFLSDLSFSAALKRLRIVLPVVCVVGLFNPFFDRTVVAHLGGLAVTGGFISMITLMVKGVLTVLASYILIATTTIEGICFALRLLHVPRILVTEILLIDRYIILLLTEANRMIQAYSLRAPGQKGVAYKVWGSLVGQLLLRSFDRADEVYAGMSLRGFNGEFPTGKPNGTSPGGAVFFVSVILLLTLLRIFPVMSLIGGIFV